MPNNDRWRRIAVYIERFSLWSGRIISWLTLAMVLLTFMIVILRYLFDLGWIWLQESVTWMHAVVFMLGAAYTLEKDEHVRVDIFYRTMTPRHRAMVDSLGIVIFLWPLCAFVLITSWDYVFNSWAIRESSREAGGLIYPFVSMLKTVILLFALLLALESVARLIRSLSTFFGAGPPDGLSPTIRT